MWSRVAPKPLTRLFLRRFIENDLVSPDADRRQVLAVAIAGLATASLFLTVLVSVKFLGPVPTGRAAVALLDDSALFNSASMIAMAILAAVQWDALAIDSRDAAILGPLPIEPGRIVRAKAVAIVIFAAACAVSLNIAGVIVHPFAVAATAYASGIDLATFAVAETVATFGAGVFGFLSVLFVREFLQIALGRRWFARVSTVAQAGVLIGLVTALVLLPGAYTGVAAWWLKPGGINPSFVPPLWFVGLYQQIAGRLIDARPSTPLRGRALAAEATALLLYQSRKPMFPHLAFLAVSGLFAVAIAAIALYLWNGRHAMAAPPLVRRQTRGRAAFTWLTSRTVVRTPPSQAGFFFAAQTLWRSAQHRTAITSAIAVGLAWSLALAQRAIARPSSAELPIVILAMQTGMLTAVAGGFRHAIRIPATPRASWLFQMAWSGEDRGYIRGVRRAAIAVLIAPVLLAFVPIFALVLGPRIALEQFLCGLVAAYLLVKALTIRIRTLPLVSTYAPSENLKALVPLYVIAFVATSYELARAIQLALTSAGGFIAVFVGAAAVTIALELVDRRDRSRSLDIELDLRPATSTQQLVPE